MSLVGALLGALTFGVGSALVPVFNAETYAVLAIGSRPEWVAATVLVLALGQTLGKVMLFEAAHRGSTRLRRAGREAERFRWRQRIEGALVAPRTAAPLVLTSATLGLPPLAVVAVVAGASGQRRALFTVACLVGRVLRFTAIAVPVVAVVRHGG